MKYNKLLFAFLLLATFFVSCNKDHYDLSNVHGINAEGEVLLPVASKTFTVRDLMERIGLQDEIEWSGSGDMTFQFDYENLGVVNGADLLMFKDVDYEESYLFGNPFQIMPPPFTDTMVSMTRSIVFESEHIHVMLAKMKLGRLDFTLESNFGNVYRVVLRSNNIKDKFGNSFVLDVPVYANTFGFDLDDLLYASAVANTLNLSYDIYFHVQASQDSLLSVDLGIKGSDMTFSQMQGFVDTYDNRNNIDSVFTLFPDNLGGAIELEGVKIKISERNSFGLGARLVVDTAMVYSEGMQPYSILEPLPLSVDLPPQLEFHEVLNREVNGQINSQGGRAYASSNFIVNPEGVSGMVTVFDTCRIDTRVSVEIPFSFAVDDIVYIDTVDMDFTNLELPDMIEQLTLDMTIASTLPLGMKGSFFLYDSENENVTDTLMLNGDVIRASFDGRPVKTDVKLVIDKERVEHLIQSNSIIMSFGLEAGAHGVDLNANQKLDLFLKARAKYKTNVDFNE